MSVAIHRGSILDVRADALINPANSFLQHGGGLAAVIDKMARAECLPLDHPERARRTALRERYVTENSDAPLIPTGGAFATSAGLLTDRGFRAIIHAVGPIWGGGDFCERTLLRSAYQEAFALAFSLDCKTVAAPAISAGIFGVPIDVVAACAVEAALSWHALDITFALMDDSHIQAFREAMP